MYGATVPAHTRSLNLGVPYEARSSNDDPAKAADAAIAEIRTAAQGFESRTGARIETGFREVGDRIDSIEARLNRVNLNVANDNVDDAETELQRRALDRFLRHGREVLSPDEVRALSVTGAATEGETTVPETFIREIIKELTEISPMRSLARVTTVGGTPVILPRRTGAPTGAWEGEQTAAGETSAAYGEWSIDVHEARVFTQVSNRLLEDSAFALESEIRTDLADAFAELEGGAFVKGDGVGKPQGLLTDIDLPTFAAAATAINADELITFFYSLKGRYRRTGSWLMNSTTIGTVRKLKDGNGNYIFDIRDGANPTLLGRPVIEDPEFPDVAINQIPVAYGDFRRGYRIVQRLGLTILPDRFSQAKNSQVLFHARMRVGAKLVLPEAVKGLLMPAT